VASEGLRDKGGRVEEDSGVPNAKSSSSLSKVLSRHREHGVLIATAHWVTAAEWLQSLGTFVVIAASAIWWT
jgi:hypothetical protein